MGTQNMVVGIPKPLLSDGVYRGCMSGNHPRSPFNFIKVWQAHNPLEVVHSDIFYINHPSLAGVKYSLTFIDDLSRFTWVYFLKNKSHVFENLRNLGHWLKINVVNLSSG
jgi:hypothetical protein